MKVRLQDQKVEVKPVYWIIFWSTKVIIFILFVLFVLDFVGYIDFKSFANSVYGGLTDFFRIVFF